MVNVKIYSLPNDGKQRSIRMRIKMPAPTPVRRAVLTAIAASLSAQIANVALAETDVGDSAIGGSHLNDRRSISPIKHVIIIVGENRTFDHIFATYRPKAGQRVDNLLSRGIVNVDGSPGPNYAAAVQYRAMDTGTYSLSPPKGGPYNQTNNKLQAPGTSYAFQAPYSDWKLAAWDGPGALTTLQVAAQAEYGLDAADLPLLLTGTTGVAPGSPDSRIANYLNLPAGPYPLVCGPAAPVVNGSPVCRTGETLYDTYAGSPVHRFYQMWQQLDCSTSHITPNNPTGCISDLFPWVEMTVAAGSNGGPPKALKEGNIAMGFYNVANGDAPYLVSLARKYVLSDNYHQGVMGGTYANFMMLGYADALYYAGPNGDPATPPAQVIENPNPQPNTNNWYAQDGYSGGSYTKCADSREPGVAPIVSYLNSIAVSPNCEPGAYYLLNNFAPAYTGTGVYAPPAPLAPFTMPPVVKQRHIGDALSAKKISWAYFGERWNDFAPAPSGAWADYPNPAVAAAYAYCNICNPFLYSASTMTDPVARVQHNKDLTDFYDAIAHGNLPAVSYVKASTFTDGHPASSKMNLFEAFTKRIVNAVKANGELWEDTAIFITVDEGGGYYDSGYVQPVDYFGDGTRIPMIVVSKYSTGGRVSHEYTDHASIIKFIERNWRLRPLSDRSRDNLPNPKTNHGDPYVPVNRPAIGDLWSAFDFGDDD
jgi:phospholipase C